jgi:hypothetical protein
MLQIVTELDGFDPRGNIKVLMATNRPDTLDPALMRPGRMDRKVANATRLGSTAPPTRSTVTTRAALDASRATITTPLCARVAHPRRVTL